MTDTMNNLNNPEDNTPRTQLKKLGRKKGPRAQSFHHCSSLVLPFLKMEG